MNQSHHLFEVQANAEPPVLVTPGDTTGSARRHDLDALRAIAMLLGIVLHGALSFFPMAWMVQDSQRSEWFAIPFALIHGFRMPLFFMLSGFFTAMLWRKRGLAALVVHRLKRIFLPLVLGCLTIVPAMWAVDSFISSNRETAATATDSDKEDPEVRVEPTDPTELAWHLAFNNDAERLSQLLQGNEVDLTVKGPDGSSILHSVAAIGHAEVIPILVRHGADVNSLSPKSDTPLHSAAFFGRAECVSNFIELGADANAVNTDGNTPLDVAQFDFATVQYIAGMYQLHVDKEQFLAGQKQTVEILKSSTTKAKESSTLIEPSSQGFDELLGFLFYFPAFHHLWFLAFLCWLVAAFVVYAAISNGLRMKRLPAWMICSPFNLVILIPLTMLPQLFMDTRVFGPDTSIGLLPIPHILGYYAVFFFFGALYWDVDDQQGVLGRWWFLTLPFTLLVLFPLGLQVVGGKASWLEGVSPMNTKLVSVLIQSLFAWLMTFGSIGLFRACFTRQSKVMRYVSDSSYWLYLAHLPLILLVQWAVRDWQFSAILKCTLVCVFVSGLLLLSYEYFVRYTPIGTLLNGKKTRNPSTLELGQSVVRS